MTVKENIQTVPVLREWSKEKMEKRVKELMYLIGLDPSIYLNKYPAELSGGQRQRIGVARCLGADPTILLMDEPFGAIDPINRGKLQDEFLKIQAKIKKTIIFVTHDINEAIKMGDKIVLMKEGEIVDYDTPSNLLYRPKNEFVRNFVGADRALKGLQLMKVKEIMDSLPKTVRAAEEIGVKASEFALHVKGLELPAHDPRVFYSLALGYATSNRGACHLQAYSHPLEGWITMPDLGYSECLPPHTEKGKAELVIKL